jgi:hypothetical protein
MTPWTGGIGGGEIFKHLGLQSKTIYVKKGDNS